MKAVVFAPHMGLSRKMKCPHCEKLDCDISDIMEVVKDGKW